VSEPADRRVPGGGGGGGGGLVTRQRPQRTCC